MISAPPLLPVIKEVLTDKFRRECSDSQSRWKGDSPVPQRSCRSACASGIAICPQNVMCAQSRFPDFRVSRTNLKLRLGALLDNQHNVDVKPRLANEVAQRCFPLDEFSEQV